MLCGYKLLSSEGFKAENSTIKLLMTTPHAVWSVAEHGPTDVLVKTLKPMMEKTGVTAYFCGHDHNMQHLNDSGIDYYVVGAGHLTDPSMAHKV